MKPATWPRDDRLSTRLLHIDVAGSSFSDKRLQELPALLRAGDVVVLNDAATLPASLAVVDRDIEVRLLGHGSNEGEFRALLFGRGDFRVPTELRPAPPRLAAGDELEFGSSLRATVTRVDPEEPRVVELRFGTSGSAFWQALYRYGRPIQYAYLERTLNLWHVQSGFAERPWAFEVPSAGLPLTWQTLFELRLRGVALTSITHAAGVSSSGSEAIDRRLPAPERYAITPRAAAVIGEAIAARRRVIAVGTTVVRALESAARGRDGGVEPGVGMARLVVRPGFEPRIVSGLLTGMHEPTSSHFALMGAFARPELLQRALEHAEQGGYLAHEFGDSCLIV